MTAGIPRPRKPCGIARRSFSGYEALKTRPLTARTAIDICSRIKGVDMDVRKTPGTQLKNSFTGEVIYTPPDGQQNLRDLLGNWEAFANAEDDLDPLVRMAVLHYQFEAIHPFLDGNGRTGRILNILVSHSGRAARYSDPLLEPPYRPRRRATIIACCRA